MIGIIIFEINTFKSIALQIMIKNKRKKQNFVPKMTLSIFGVEFLKSTIIFEFSAIEFVKLQNFVQNKKILKLAPKMPNLGILGVEF